MFYTRCSTALLLLAVLCYWALSAHALAPQKQRPKLQRSDGKRWERLDEIVRTEISSATAKFLAERQKALHVPLEVDILLIGFGGDGGYAYTFDLGEMEEILGSATEDSIICPTIWETGEPAAICYNVNYITLDNKLMHNATKRIEDLLRSEMQHVGDRSHDWNDGNKNTQVYEVEASGHVEEVISEMLEEAYGGELPKMSDGHSQHNAIVIMNPNKLRMSPWATVEQVAEIHDFDFIGHWKNGDVNVGHLVDQEGGFMYRYKYHGAGGAAAWLSQYNFLVIDISAGPAIYGPMTSPHGAVAPVAIPRLLPMLVKMAKEVESTPVGTLKTFMLEQAVDGQHALFVGQLASTVAAATRHLFAPDLKSANMRKADRVLVPIVVLQEHAYDLVDDERHTVDLEAVQVALDEICGHGTHAMATVSHHYLHHHRGVMAALARARTGRAAPVLLEPPKTGMHSPRDVHIDSAVLMRELRLVQDTLLLGLVEPYLHDDYHSGFHPDEDEEEGMARRRAATHVVPVFVLSLHRGSEQTMFDNHQLVAAGHDMAVVLQLLNGEEETIINNLDGARLRSGHQLEGHTLMVDAASHYTRHVIAGAAAALGAMVPPYQRFCTLQGGVVEDWRWAVGAQPWGPYSNYSGISEVMATTARRHHLVSRIEATARKLQQRMEQLDTFIEGRLQGPFSYLHVTDTDKYGNLELHPHHHMLNTLASQSMAYAPNATTKPDKKKQKAKSANPGEAEAPIPMPPPYLTVDVAGRLKGQLQPLSLSLQGLAYHLFTKTWDLAEQNLDELAVAVDTFGSIVHTDLMLAEDVLSCCTLMHETPLSATYFALALFLVVMSAFAIVACVAIRAQKTWKPSGRGRDKAQSLPTWAALPR